MTTEDNDVEDAPVGSGIDIFIWRKMSLQERYKVYKDLHATSLKIISELTVPDMAIKVMTKDFHCHCGRLVTDHVCVSRCECGESWTGPEIKTLLDKDTLDDLKSVYGNLNKE